MKASRQKVRGSGWRPRKDVTGGWREGGVRMGQEKRESEERERARDALDAEEREGEHDAHELLQAQADAENAEREAELEAELALNPSIA